MLSALKEDPDVAAIPVVMLTIKSGRSLPHRIATCSFEGMTRQLFALFIAIGALAAPLDAQAPAATRGTLYIVGGGPQPAALVQEFVDLTGGRGKARILVFAMASASGERSGEAKAADLRALGAEAHNVWITRKQAMTDSVARLLDGVTGVWFGGGDQNRLAAVLRGTATERAIHARYAAGAVIGEAPQLARR